MTLTKLLLWMHDDFRYRMAGMGRIVRQGGVGEASELTRALSLLIPVLQAHEWVEENILHPALRRHAATFDRGDTDHNEVRHQDLHEKFDELARALANPQAPLALFLATDNFSKALLQHLEDEEKTVLRIANDHLPQDLQEKLGNEALESLRQADLPLGALPSDLLKD